MFGESDLYNENRNLIRLVENFDIKSTGAFAKRNGTRLIESSPLEMYAISTKKKVFVFFSDNEYKIISLEDFTEIEAKKPNPTGLSFKELSSAKIKVNEDLITISLKSSIFRTDKANALNLMLESSTVSNYELNNFLSIPQRSVIAFGSTFLFSYLNNEFSFSFGSSSTPTDGFQLDYLIGSNILDAIFFDEYIVFSTHNSINTLSYPRLNPFASGGSIPTIKKIYSGEVNNNTLITISDGIIFSNDNGVFFISTNIVNHINISELTTNALHITSEEGYYIKKISSYYMAQNVFFCLRNDGVIFKGVLNQKSNFNSTTGKISERSAYFSRITTEGREYVDIDYAGRVLITKSNNFYYCELSKEFPYLSDNKRRYDQSDLIESFKNINFLDCFKKYHVIINRLAYVTTKNNFTCDYDLKVGKEYYVNIDNDTVEVIKINKKIVNVYTYDKDFDKNFIVIGEQVKQIDITEVMKYNDSQKIYMTYASIEDKNIKFETKEISEKEKTDKKVNVFGFFAVVGFGYDSNLGMFIRFPNRGEMITLEYSSFNLSLINVSTHTRTGIERTNTIKKDFTSSIDSVIQSTRTNRIEKDMTINIPIGYYGVIVSLDNQDVTQRK